MKVYAFTGDVFLCRKQIQHIAQKYDNVVEASWTSLEEALDSESFLPESNLYVLPIEELDAVKTQHLMAHGSSSAVVVFKEGAVTKQKNVLDLIPDKQKAHHESPNPWKAPKVAASFLKSELKRLGKTMPENLSEIVVKNAGTDFGILANEALKISWVASSDTITLQDLTLVFQSEAPTESLLLAIIDGPMHTSKAIQNLRSSMDLVAVLKYLQGSLLRIFPVAYMLSRGKSAKEIEVMLEENRYYLENTLIPRARGISYQKMVRIFGVIADTHDRVFEGQSNNWEFFESSMLNAMMA